MSIAASKTIVRQTRGGCDPASQRFAILSEMEMAHGRAHFLFTPIGPEMTLLEVSDALIRRGISQRDAFKLIDDATRAFARP
jgi:hypothetical protein